MNGIYDYFNAFWSENDKHPFNPTEHALFHYLLNEANRNRWVMPFASPTIIISYKIGASCVTIRKARASLHERGIIDFRPGVNRETPTTYTILGVADFPLEERLALSQELPLEFRLEERHYNNKDRIKDNDNFSLPKSGKTEIDILKDLFVGDTEWLSNIVWALGSPKIRTPADIRPFLDKFFSEQVAKGIKEREESDCRSHFFNWLKLVINQNQKNNDNNKRNADRHRGTEVSHGSAADFESSF